MSPQLSQIRSGCPLTKDIKGEYSFIHKTFQEYFTAKYMIHNIETNTLTPELIIKSEPISRFLKEMLTNEMIKEIREKYLENPKISKEQNISACAITILNVAEVNFSNWNFRDINISGAILANGNFDSTIFSNSNLSNCDLSNAWFRSSKFSNSTMNNILFREMPMINCKANVLRIFHSPCKKYIIVGLREQNAPTSFICVYDSLLQNLIKKIDHSSHVICELVMNKNGIIALLGYANDI